MTNVLLKLRKMLKSKRPTLRRHDSHKKAALKSAWRKPRGLQNKVRLQKKGYASNNNMGWASPKVVRGLNKLGLKPVLVSTLNELKALDPKKKSAIVSSTLGAKKKVLLLEKAKVLKIVVDNIKDLDVTISKINNKFSSRKSEKDLRVKKKAAKVKDSQKNAKKKLDEKVVEKEKVEDLSDEDKKKAAEAEKQKILTQKQ